MNRWELKDRLVAAGVPDGNYFLVGVDSQQTPGKGGGFGELVVAPADGGRGWTLCTQERGRIQRERHFATEDEACAAAWEELKPLDVAVRKRTPQERARARARAQEMVAEYDSLADDHRDTGGANGSEP